ncbi:unnamed protein product, partial [Rotaria sp. Silwood2]
MITRDAISSSQIRMNEQSSQFITRTETQSPTGSILSKEADTTIGLSTITSISASNSTYFPSQSVDTLTAFVSQNALSTDASSTLSSAFQHTSTSTKASLHLSSEHTTKIADEITTESTTINDKYQTSVELTSQNSEIGTNQIATRTNSISSTSVDNNGILPTSMTPSTTIEIKSSLLTSSENIHTTIRSNGADTTINQDQPSMSRSITEPLSTSVKSTLSEEITTYTSKTAFATSADILVGTSMISDEQTSSTIVSTNEISSIDDTTISSVTSAFHSTNVQQNGSTLSIPSMATVDNVSLPLTNLPRATALFSTTATITTETYTTTDNSWKTSQNQLKSTTGYMNEETASSTFSFSRTQTSTDTASNIVKNNQTISETSFDLSTNTVTTTTIASNSTDGSSMPTSILPNNVALTIETTPSTNTKLNSSQTTSLLSSESDLLQTFHAATINSFKTTEPISSSIENQLETSTDNVYITNPTGNIFSQSSTISSILSSSSIVSSTTDKITPDAISNSQISMNEQSSQFTTRTETQSPTVSVLSKKTDTTIDLGTVTSISASNSTYFTSQSADTLTRFVSKNAASTNPLSTLSAGFENTSTSTETSLHLSSEHTTKITDQMTTESTTINDKYQTSIELSSQNSEMGTTQIVTRTNSASSTSLDNNGILLTSMAPTTTIEMKSSLLTSSEDIRTTIRSNGLETTINQDQSTISRSVTEPMSTSAKSTLSEEITAYTSETTSVASTNTFVDTSMISDKQISSPIALTNEISSIDDTTVSFVTSAFHSTNVEQNGSSSSIPSMT